jgi:hypothetical protein
MQALLACFVIEHYKMVVLDLNLSFPRRHLDGYYSQPALFTGEEG